MKKNVINLCALVLSILITIVYSSCSQKRLPLIKATSSMVDVRDGNEFKKSDWRISPKIKPDVYKTINKDSTVTFYTDIDSISFLVKKDKAYDFIILLNGKDSAFTRIQNVPTFLEVLKIGRKYDFQDNNIKVKFPYKSENNSDLKSLRTKFRLDSIAGSGDEISKYLNILHWVHTTFHHDGSKDAPQAVGVEDLMTKCIRDQKTMDCGSLAFVLSNCYLAMGFKSKRIICLPKDSTDFDCHSINVVYSKTLKKWLWMDPTNDAYVMNEHNELLGISEVRECLINDKPLKLNSDANRNHIVSVRIEEYLFNYMAKNLYALESSCESNGISKSILLLPLDYKGILPRTKSPDLLCTHNPDIFWAIPE
jgi:hypothetical protein